MSVAFAVVEMMLGGDGSAPAFIADRPLTMIERAVVGVFFERSPKRWVAPLRPSPARNSCSRKPLP